MEPANIFIYKAMDPHAGYRILDKNEQLKKDLTNTNHAIWLVRESNREGRITIDCAFFSNHVWKNGSMRFLLSKEGWKLDHNEKIAPAAMSAEEACRYIDQLHEVILKSTFAHFKRDLKFDPKHRMNPEISLQSTSKIYSGYHGENEKIALTPDVEQALTCDVTGKYFKDPVFMLKTETIKGIDGKEYTLYKGRSYEKSVLEKANPSCDWYQSNATLKQIVDKITPLSGMRIDSLTESLLEDPLMDVEGDQNVTNFKQGWPRCKGFLEQHLQTSNLKRQRDEEEAEEENKRIKKGD